MSFDSGIVVSFSTQQQQPQNWITTMWLLVKNHTFAKSDIFWIKYLSLLLIIFSLLQQGIQAAGKSLPGQFQILIFNKNFKIFIQKNKKNPKKHAKI